MESVSTTLGVNGSVSPDTGAGVDEKESKAPYNVLLITCDQERRWEDLPLRAEDFKEAFPERARLRQESTHFTQATICACPCTPARSVLFSGRHLQQTGCYTNNRDLPGDLSVGNIFKACGYDTALFGKWHLLLRGRNFEGNKESYDKWREMIVSRFGVNADEVWPQPADFSKHLSHQGFETWNVDGEVDGYHEGYTRDPNYAHSAINYLKSRKEGDAPFFMSVNFVNPHDIMFFTASDNQHNTRSKVGPGAFLEFDKEPADEIYERKWNPTLPRTLYSHDSANDQDSHQLPAAHLPHKRSVDQLFGKFSEDQEDVDHQCNMNYYINCLRDVDRHIGAVLRAIDESPLLRKNTIVVFTADHGEMLGSHGQRQKGGLVYKENLGVPLLVRHPEVPIECGREVHHIVSSADIVPTVLSLAVGKQRMLEETLPGQDLSELILNSSATRWIRDEKGALFQFGMLTGIPPKSAKAGSPGFRPLCQAIVTKQYVYGRFSYAESFPQIKDCNAKTLEDLKDFDLVLYDRSADPDEIHNLAVSGNSELILQMNERLQLLIESETREKGSSCCESGCSS